MIQDGRRTTSHISSASAIWCLWKIGWEGLWGVLRGSSISEGSQYFHNIWFSLDNEIQDDSPSREIFKPPVIVKSDGRTRNYPYPLSSSSHGSEHGNVLGKLQIDYVMNLSGGCKYIFQLMAYKLIEEDEYRTPIVPQKIELHVVEVPSTINLDRPFLVIPVLFWVHLNLSNQTDRIVYFLEVWLSQDDTLDEKA
ncbi:hypothetical protein OIU74_006629 [Salix koriyanagi]|uniref:Uncharacterized protein n=1 Tax=Salix koriyanagi TaxID=2511006 RepID=A0A9Q0ZBT7_9ROSI|nr:hypothetical protein OIU74_006629 [Salix koriyanagi]